MKINVMRFYEHLGKLGKVSVSPPIEKTALFSNCIADGSSICGSFLETTVLSQKDILGLFIFHLHIDLNTSKNIGILTTV